MRGRSIRVCAPGALLDYEYISLGSKLVGPMCKQEVLGANNSIHINMAHYKFVLISKSDVFIFFSTKNCIFLYLELLNLTKIVSTILLLNLSLVRHILELFKLKKIVSTALELFFSIK